jgi:hypothetical protein
MSQFVRIKLDNCTSKIPNEQNIKRLKPNLNGKTELQN